jgi:sugar phosphate isomerase/epimerase
VETLATENSLYIFAEMKFAICNETFVDWPFDRACAFARQCGYTGLEIAPFTLGTRAEEISPLKRKGLVADALREGLQIIGLHWLLAKTEGFYLTTPDASVRKKTAEYLAELVRLCRDLGGHLMVLGSPKQRNLLPGVSHSEGMKWAADTLERVLPVLDECKVTIALEPLGPEEGDFLNTADLAVDLMHMIGSPHCRLHLDVKAMSTEKTPVCDIIQKHVSCLAHFHANDPNRRGPGMGDVDFRPILQTLRNVGYDDWVSVEVFDYEPGPERLARESIENLRKAMAVI